ncbi:hypothetical protein BGX24_010636 [Mortierella sp. AD032]|nr:hypothetical protein BGX24_010636 [Mortierella sp. AD032]
MQGGVSGTDVTKIIPPAPEPIPGSPGAARDTCGIKGDLLQGLIQQLAPKAQVPACEENVHSSIFICKKDRGNSGLRLESSLNVLITFDVYCNNGDRIQSREAKASILGRLSD